MGFSIVIPDFQEENKLCVYLTQEQTEYRVDMGESANGNVRRIINVLKDFEHIVDKEFHEMTQTSKQIKELQYSLASQNENSKYSKQLREREKEVEEIKVMIKIREGD